MFDEVLILNPVNFSDRRKAISNQLDMLKLPYKFIHDYDISDISQEICNQYFNKKIDMSIAQKSCALKHIRAHQIVLERQYRKCLILEDDVILAKNFIQIVNKAMKESEYIEFPKVLFLGCGGNFYTPISKIKNNQLLYAAEKGRFGDSYVLDYQSAKLRLDWISKNKLSAPCDNTFDEIDPLLGVKMYWLEPPVVEQGSKNGLYRCSLVKSPPKFIQGVKFRLEKIRRKYVYRFFN
jgi:glycosyl transferase family 25